VLAVRQATVVQLLQAQQSLLSQVKQRLAAAQVRALAAAQARRLAAARAAYTAETAAFTSSAAPSTGITTAGVLPPPANYLALYRSAATTCSGLPWTVLAAIGQVESGHGRNDGPSSAGAMGPMQFEPATFQAYAVDGDHDGRADIDDPADAIYTAAHYLCANGGGRGPEALNNAILDYNHAQWYATLVENLANKYAAAYPSGGRSS
jgi:membrane-bound lytic murein transglycosylase B